VVVAGVALVRWVAVLAAAARLAAPAADAAAPAPEYQVKAAFLYNFAKFVDWPAHEVAGGGPLHVCVIGDDPFGSFLPETLEGKSVRDRRLTLRHLEGPADASSCHIAFVSPSEEAELPRLLASLAAASVLTVGETSAFERSGGMITFHVEGSKIRFAINVDAAERAGLKISSQLLKLATRVVQ
jgi:hypothetical protein